MGGNCGESISFLIPLSRVTIAPGRKLAAFLLEVTEDRIGVIRDIAELLSNLKLSTHQISAYVESGKGGVYLVVNLPEGLSLDDLESKLSSIKGIGRVLHQACDVEGLLIDDLNFPSMGYGDRIFTLTDKAWASLRSNLINTVGPQACYALIFRIGYEMGKGFAETYSEIARRVGIEDPLEVIRYVMVKMFAASGWAKAQLEVSEWTLKLTLKDGLEATVSERSEEPSCYFTKGVLTGALTRIFRVPVEVTEVSCQAAGDDHCEFSVSYA
ncbi:MAG: XylR N-terminal domain-containing protein [Candidatus Korarchaeum sp.]|nr:XylR N-terminal domain-containing protein [Candidatus Korarchaeum sp.]MDW8035166.1 V4R domain-containing protein [Candidatus Korarchaeum sp.]